MSRLTAASAVLAAMLAGCGGGNPLGNPPAVANALAQGGQKLSFVYFQKCIDPIFDAQLSISRNGAASVNTCASGGCHASATGTGGAFRVEPLAPALDLSDPANTPEVIRASAMYRNFYSAEAATVIGVPAQSRLFAKPLLLNTLHGGGQILDSDQDPVAKLLAYWIAHPVPEGHDEFSTAASAMFTPADPATGTCNTQ